MQQVESQSDVLRVIQEDPWGMLTWRLHDGGQAARIGLAGRPDTTFIVEATKVREVAEWLAELGAGDNGSAGILELADESGLRRAAFFGETTDQHKAVLEKRNYRPTAPDFAPESRQPDSTNPPQVVAEHTVNGLVLGFNPDVVYEAGLMVPADTAGLLGHWTLRSLDRITE
jgi:hypothetical protein